jgi:hypothetical protein
MILNILKIGCKHMTQKMELAALLIDRIPRMPDQAGAGAMDDIGTAPSRNHRASQTLRRSSGGAEFETAPRERSRWS